MDPVVSQSERQASKLELLGRLSSAIVHNFNNLLALQNNALAMIRAALPPGSVAAGHVNVLGDTITQAKALTDRLLGLVRPVPPRPERPLDLNEVCVKAVELLRSSVPQGIVPESRLRAGLPTIHADSNEMLEVLLNLCLNAIDAMPQGGRLEIRTEQRRLAPGVAVPAPAGRQGAFVCLIVSDTGEGIPAEIRERIFEPFFSTKPAGRGTGLGLASVRDIVQSAGGWIHCTSTLGHGTTFTVWLPASISARMPAPAPPVMPSRVLARKTILVVDDDPQILRLARDVLQPRGHNVLTAGDGRAAVELFRQQPDSIDLAILLDRLPGLPGLEVMSELLALKPALPLILMTGGGAPESEWMARRPDLPVLPKPWQPADLLHHIANLLGSEVKEGG
jgi:CheY-like chemotaxis protein